MEALPCLLRKLECNIIECNIQTSYLNANESVSHFSYVFSYVFQPHALEPCRLLSPWDSPGKNTGVGCHFLLQGIFPTQTPNTCLLCLLDWQGGSLPLVPPGKSLTAKKQAQKSSAGGTLRLRKPKPTSLPLRYT